jgi:hypothetical protein
MAKYQKLSSFAYAVDNGNLWLNTLNGQLWLKEDGGKTWLKSQDGYLVFDSF